MYDICACIYSDWLTSQHRDTYASYVSHPSLTNYFALAENKSIGRTKYDMLTVYNISYHDLGLLRLFGLLE